MQFFKTKGLKQRQDLGDLWAWTLKPFVYTSSLGNQTNINGLNTNSLKEKKWESKQKSVKLKTMNQYRKSNNKKKGWFFEKIHKINKPLYRLRKIKRHKLLIPEKEEEISLHICWWGRIQREGKDALPTNLITKMKWTNSLKETTCQKSYKNKWTIWPSLYLLAELNP